MRTLLVCAALASLHLTQMLPTEALAAASVCDAPFTGCLAKCGNKVTTSKQETTDQQGCFIGCRLAKADCLKRLPSVGHGHWSYH